ncbi:MAG: AAA family ATPase [Coriobacteriales bacterium]|nr:AAA family ATPase [Coriobacteriales bacterium]
MPSELGPEDIYRACDTSKFEFKTTDELPELDEIIGQSRAVSSVEFGVGVGNDGYNIFAFGPPGTGKSSVINEFLRRQAASLPVPDDWVYVHNFDEHSKPSVIRMVAGRGQEFRKSMERLVEDLRVAITQAFESEDYAKQRQSLVDEYGDREKAHYDALSKKAGAQGFGIVASPAGIAFVPKTPEGEAMPQETYEALPPEQRKHIDAGMKQLNEELQQTMRAARRVERDGREAVRDLDRQVTTFAARHIIDDACEHWCTTPGVTEYLHAMLDDVVDNAEDFKQSEEETPQTLFGMPVPTGRGRDGFFRKYRINVIVDNSQQKGAPVVTESNPVLQNLLGRVEHRAEFGALLTDFNMIKAGALHKANGGFLVLDAREVLTKPYAWDALKRTLKTGEIRIEDVAQQLGFATTATLDPTPIPFKAKIVLIGEPFIYYLLYSSDPDFQELFKIRAEFDTVVDRTAETESQYARFIGSLCKERSLAPFAPEGVARVIEHSSRLVGDQDKTTTRFLDVADLVTEASYWARKDHGDGEGTVVARADVQKAIDERIYRSNRLEERLRERIAEATLLLDVEGAVTGQVNGLSVTSLGDYMFGFPTRITATHRLGEGDVVDIEREVEMGGPIHSKGVLILAGYLGAKYAADRPLSLMARLVFEQSYSGVEGDSASSTELYALLSSLSGLPIKQRFAVTGSVNQLGQVQAIGGVNEKVEGFFEVCEALDPGGDHGVLIPQANVRHLMLNDRVREAVEARRFHIHPVSTIDEGISVLTGVPAGEPDAKGVYPEGSVNRLVVDRLAGLAEEARRLAAEKRKAAGESSTT